MPSCTIATSSGSRVSGVPGKTVLCQSLDGAAYFDCELPRVHQALEDPKLFFRDRTGSVVVLDEIHRLMNPESAS